MHIQSYENHESKFEYGCDFRRLFPWKDTVDPVYWGSGWCYVRPGNSTIEHSHDEHETFIVTGGTGIMSVDGNMKEVSKGDIIYLPPFSKHNIKNTSDKDTLEVLCIWWGSEEAKKNTLDMLRNQVVGKVDE